MNSQRVSLDAILRWAAKICHAYRDGGKTGLPYLAGIDSDLRGVKGSAMFGGGLNLYSPFVDHSASIAAAQRAVENLKPEGHEWVRNYLAAIFEKWKLEYGFPPAKFDGIGGLLGAFSEEPKPISKKERLAAVIPAKPWQCAGPWCTNQIDLFLKLWTEHGTFLEPFLKKEQHLFFWFLGLLIIDHEDDYESRYSVLNAGQILLKIFLEADKNTIALYETELGALTKKTAMVAAIRKKGGATTAAIKKAKGQVTTSDIHRRATELLKTKEKRDVAGIIKVQTSYSKSTIHTALQSHSSGLWKKSSAS